MDDLLVVLSGLIALVLVGLAAMIAGDRARQGFRRAENEKLGRQHRQYELTARLQQVERAIEEQEGLIASAERELARMVEENDGLRAVLDRTEYPFVYTAVPLESRDMHARVFRFTARHPTMSEGTQAPDPVAQWDQGRFYAVAASNQAEARSVVDRLLQRQKGFIVVNAGETGTESTEQPA